MGWTHIQIQGDGIDTDGNGMPDAKIDLSAIRISVTVEYTWYKVLL